MVASRPGSPQPGGITVLNGTISNGLGGGHQAEQAVQSPPSAPVIPPISSELAGSPVYQEQQHPPTSTDVPYFYQSALNLLGGENNPCRQFVGRVFTQLASPLGEQSFESVEGRYSRTYVANNGMLGDDAGRASTTADGSYQIAFDFTNVKETGPYSSIYVYLHEMTHTATPVAGELVSHFSMAEAAYSVGRSMDIVPEASGAPTRTMTDTQLSKYFQVILYKACPPPAQK
jgi:hypothetical protein